MRPELVQWLEFLSEGAILPGSPRQSRAWKSVHAPRFTKYTSGPLHLHFSESEQEAN